MTNRLLSIVVTLLSVVLLSFSQPVIRHNQVGYLPADVKSAIVLSEQPIEHLAFTVMEARSGEEATKGMLTLTGRSHGAFRYIYQADFSNLKRNGEYALHVSDFTSSKFKIGPRVFHNYLSYPSFYLLEQRCGYNPVFDTVCHQHDGIAVDGPDAGKFVDNVGGYHDASDYLRFLITTSYSTGIQLLAYVDYPKIWVDSLDRVGKKKPNGIPDVLDEARWGLEWMLKMNPDSGKLYHQSADDRDHAFWDLPYRDSSDYGWGKGKKRPVYFATGAAQGLFEYKNRSTGVSNVAGRTAAVFALGASIWREVRKDSDFSRKLLRQSVNLYALARSQLGHSESVPCKASYRFHEKTYFDDLEWAAAELYRVTKEKNYLAEAIQYAFLAADTAWMGKDTAHHYEYFPYVNPGHYRLFGLVKGAVRDSLLHYYRLGLLAAKRGAEKNAFAYGVPFIWVSNNLATGLITQAIWYKKMSGSSEFDPLLYAARDWLFGRNPWGQSFVIGVPEDGKYPADPHSVVRKELGLRLTGALVDGPVYGSIFSSLKGLRLTRDDPFAKFQSAQVVYHDDVGDYSTNEPTLDGTASLLYILAHFSK